MADAVTVQAAEFSRNFDRYRDRALDGALIKVESGGRVVGAYLSADELDRFERLKRRESEVLVVGELPDDLIAEIEAAEYGASPR